jgi:hypothetical protein
MGKRLEKLKVAIAKEKKEHPWLNWKQAKKVVLDHKKKAEATIQKAREYRDKAYKKGGEIQKQIGKFREDYPVLGGSGDLFGLGEQKRHDLGSVDLFGNVGVNPDFDMFGMNPQPPKTTKKKK